LESAASTRVRLTGGCSASSSPRPATRTLDRTSDTVSELYGLVFGRDDQAMRTRRDVDYGPAHRPSRERPDNPEIVGILIDPRAPSGDTFLHVLLVAAVFIILRSVVLFFVLLPWAAIESQRSSSRARAEAINRATMDGGSKEPPQ
jgi:hypothetical protein